MCADLVHDLMSSGADKDQDGSGLQDRIVCDPVHVQHQQDRKSCKNLNGPRDLVTPLDLRIYMK